MVQNVHYHLPIKTQLQFSKLLRFINLVQGYIQIILMLFIFEVLCIDDLFDMHCLIWSSQRSWEMGGALNESMLRSSAEEVQAFSKYSTRCWGCNEQAHNQEAYDLTRKTNKHYEWAVVSTLMGEIKDATEAHNKAN